MANILVYESETMCEVLCLPLADITSLQIRDGNIRIVHRDQDSYKVISYPLSQYSIITIE